MQSVFIIKKCFSIIIAIIDNVNKGKTEAFLMIVRCSGSHSITG